MTTSGWRGKLDLDNGYTVFEGRLRAAFRVPGGEMNPDQRPPDAPKDRLPEPLRLLDSLAAIALHHFDRALDGIRYRHAEQSIPADELDYHQDEHCLCGPTIEALPEPVDGARWLVSHWRALTDADLEHED